MEYTLYFRHMMCAFLVGTTGRKTGRLAIYRILPAELINLLIVISVARSFNFECQLQHCLAVVDIIRPLPADIGARPYRIPGLGLNSTT
jgi:hypothetical protein